MTIVYTDASCRIKDGVGGWAYWVDDKLKGSGPMSGKVTPTACELVAAACALNRLRKEGVKEVELRTDSQYVEIASGGGIGMVANKRLIKRFARMIKCFDKVQIRHIPEHSERGHEITHRMCRARCREQLEGMRKNGTTYSNSDGNFSRR